MARFEEVKPKLLAVDDQMHCIMNLKQGDTSNEDFVKLLSKELKVYEKHGGDFLWGQKQKSDLESLLEYKKEQYLDLNGLPMPDEVIQEQFRIIKKRLQEEIVATAIMKRADKKRYGNLQIQMKNNFLMGNDMYPTSVADVIRILDNYEKEWPVSSKPSGSNEGKEISKRTGVAFALSQGKKKIHYLKGSNNSFFPAITCNICGVKGHYQSHCPVCTQEGSKVEQEEKTAEATVEK